MRFLILLACLHGAAFGQRVLYNSSLDKVGQSAATAGKVIASDTVTTKELQNLAIIEKDQVDGALQAGLLTARAQVETLGKWESVPKRLAGICQIILLDPLREWPLSKADILLKATPGSECAVLTELINRPPSTTLADQKKEIDARIALLKKQLENLQGASKENPPSLSGVISQLGTAKDITDFIGSLKNLPGNDKAKDASAALKPIIDGLKELNQLIDTATTIWRTQRDVSVDPRTVGPSKEETQLAVLSEDIQYLKDLMLIRSRRALDDTAFVQTLTDVLPQYEALTKRKAIDPKSDMRDDLARSIKYLRPPAGQAAPRPKDPFLFLIQERIRLGVSSDLQSKLDILYATGSLFAQNNMASNVALLRETIAWRRHSIRLHAIDNGTYEQTIQIATQRLAAYYAAGFKPSQIAQLIHDIAAAVSLPKIAF